MFQTRSEYDQGVNTFNPRGRLFQVEYAIRSIKLGSTAMGIQTSEGVVLLAEKRTESKLMVASTMKKCVQLDEHMGCAVSGLVADARTLVQHGRVTTQGHWFTYNEKIGVEATVQRICDLTMKFGEKGQARPYGVSLLVAGVDENGPCLFHTDPAGTFTKYLAKAIGGGSEGAQTSLEEQYHKSLTLEEAKKMGLEILKQVMEEKLNEKNVEMAVITVADPVFRTLSQEEIGSVIKTLAADLI